MDPKKRAFHVYTASMFGPEKLSARAMTLARARALAKRCRCLAFVWGPDGYSERYEAAVTDG